MAWSEIITFFVAASLLVMSPGPNGILIAKTLPTSGNPAAFANVGGFIAAFYLHGTLAILGISIILVQSAAAFTIIKYLGAAYLCWIGIKALMEAYQGADQTSAIAPARRRRTLINAFSEGFLTNALNPKVSMFYLAAFPQFITPGETSVFSSFGLVTIHAAINALWFGGMILLFSKLSRAASGPHLQRSLKAITGIVFIGFGLKLATTRAPGLP